LSDPLLAVVFALAALVSLAASWLLVSALERVGARVGLSEALLGMLAALAADAPEITSAVTALSHHDQRIGAGVVIGSNVFNLAALIGLSGIVAGRVALHRRVIELAGTDALWIAGVTLAVVLGGVSPALGLVLVLAVLVPYMLVLGLRHDRLARLPLPDAWAGWLVAAVTEEETELEAAIHPARGHARDALLAGGAVVVVVGASIAMEQAASKLGSRHAVPGILIGALALAAVTSLPNAVAGVYLASRDRATAALSTAFNSNAFNVLAGLLVMTMLVLLTSYLDRGLRRAAGLVIVTAYAAFTATLLAIS
jgi:cation:H+ antiporter